jgi:two-component system response regulator (stage 0 sporulation protein A)
LERLEVSYLIRKPCEPAAIAERAEDIIRFRGERKTAEPGFLELLIELGVPLHLKGGKYLREAVVLMQERPGQYMTKELYPTVGQRFDTNARTVERDIRTVIELAWKKRDRELWKRVFLPVADPDAKKPSNTVFIGTIAAMFDRYAG